jgi:outer membrane protein assembly factor BamB
MHRMNQGLRLAALVTTAAWLGGASGAWASGPNLFLTPSENHPNSTTQVAGNGFSPYAAVDIYFDSTDEALAIANGAGKFTKIPVPVSASALPGTHYITAVQRSNGQGAQQVFTVNTDWAQLGFNEKHKGLNAWENVLTPSNVSSLDQAWTGAPTQPSVASPAVVNGVVYFGSQDGFLYTFNAATGTPGWTYNVGSDVGTSVLSPAVANGVVYVTGSRGEVDAINASTGANVWSTTTPNYIYGSPAVANGIVYVSCYDDNLYAFNASTGAMLWSSATGGSIYGSPAVANNVAYVGSLDGYLYAFNAKTGVLLWNTAIAEFSQAAPAVANGTVYFSASDEYGNGYLYAFAANSGGQVWKSSCDGCSAISPAAANGVIYLQSITGAVAFDANTGAQLWLTPLGNDFISASPVIANGVVYIGSCGSGPNFSGLDAATGSVLWSAAAHCISASAAVSDGMVYFGDYNDNILYAYALNGGNDAVYHRHGAPPKFSSLHPDLSLKPSN